MKTAAWIRTAQSALLGTLVCTGMASAANLMADFEAGLPAGSTIFGDAVVVGGALQLTDAQNSQWGVFVWGPLGNVPISSFTASFQLRFSDSICCGGGTLPADGMSFNFTNAVPNPPSYGDPGEEGLPTGLVIAFDTWDNGSGEAPAIDVKMDGASKGSFSINPYTGPRYVDVNITLDPDGTLDVDFDGQDIFTDLQTGHVETTGGQFVFGARTGGANAKHLIDNLSITTRGTTSVPDGGSTLLMLGGTLTGLAGSVRLRKRYSRGCSGGGKAG
jgi:hypothetical protein